ncbi:hypothetical protein LCGC14_0943810 [marine sediment metagenome]|uniref:MPN domain-containing protein n=1 Tax=marine sediment metagenome TaxID=412755 RepID=A0A0F9R2V4_9ZZZZ|nr:hypothetical protein [bacterium]
MPAEYKVLIKTDALIRMITHVLKFGNEALEENSEVMGVCIGQINEINNQIILHNIHPIQHGSIGFTREDIELFNQLNKDYQEKEMQLVGWYISRPDWGLDFTDITLQNHKFFQTVKNPQGFIIIFDHTLMGKENGFGFKIYTLKDINISNEIREVSYEIEVPDSLNFFKWVQKFMEDSQRVSPVLITELKEQSTRQLQEIPLSDEDLVEVGMKDYSDQVDIIAGFRNGSLKLSEIIGETYQNQLNTWVSDMTRGSLKGTELIRGSLNQLKIAVSDGLKNVQIFFNTTFAEISGLFKKNITEYINSRVVGVKELKNEISTILEETIEESKKKIEENIQGNFTPLNDATKSIRVRFENTTALNSKMTSLVTQLSSIVSDMEIEIKNITGNIGEHIENNMSKFELGIKKKFEELNTEINPIKEGYSEIKILFEKLQKIITNFRNLT